MKRKRSASEWVVILNRLAEVLPQDHPRHVTVIGGAAMILGYGAQRMTDDVDAVMTPEVAAEVIPAAMAIAPEFGLDPQWLNQQAMAASLIVAPKIPDKTVFAARSLVLEAPPVEHMLAMKITAYRSYKDWDDAALLLKRMERSGLFQRGGCLERRRWLRAVGEEDGRALQLGGLVGSRPWNLNRLS